MSYERPKGASPQQEGRPAREPTGPPLPTGLLPSLLPPDLASASCLTLGQVQGP